MVDRILDQKGSLLSVNSGRNTSIKDRSNEINLETPKMDRNWEEFHFKQREKEGWGEKA